MYEARRFTLLRDGESCKSPITDITVVTINTHRIYAVINVTRTEHHITCGRSTHSEARRARRQFGRPE